MPPLIQARNIVKHFPVRGGMLNRIVRKVHAVNDVSFDINKGEILGVVGESGCGKSTLGKVIIRLIEPTSGSIKYDGKEVTDLDHAALMPLRKRMQIIFQDPYSSLNPRLTVRALLKEAIRLHNIVPPQEMDDYIVNLAQTVGLRPDAVDRFPHEFSGGQRQRIGIARALALKPEFIIADEPVSALDVSIQAQVLNLMMELKETFGLTMMFISHDLKVIEHFCDRVLVMYLGHLVETLSCDNLHEDAKHPYTKALLGANPINDPDERRPLTVLQGDVPSPFNMPKGCPFAGRCPLVEPRCRTEMPPLKQHSNGQAVACWVVNEPQPAAV
ncbi:MAG: ATP-binding cassette domain-containing protein [Phycisphaeraceae bacterium]|nr:ATP-binding cassette domain-containing protein [Phycisphaerales bacterium]MCB9860762.1 ATP-binding cassette domain-containing protein [Phycisphaeraceae bacterium]